MRLLVSHRPVLDAFRNDEQFAGPEQDLTIAHLDAQSPLEDQKQIVRL